MFTGIITHLGNLNKKSSSTLTFSIPIDLYQKLTLGTSIAVNGICLTVTEVHEPNFFSISYMPETAHKTTIQYLNEQDSVNLELSVTAETLFAGHLVQGHVDGVSQILDITDQGNSRIFTFQLSDTLNKYVVNKGSIAVNGISLTVIETTHSHFTVGIIPHTWDHTMLHSAQVGDHVNIEVDVIAKYVEKMLTPFISKEK